MNKVKSPAPTKPEKQMARSGNLTPNASPNIKTVKKKAPGKTQRKLLGNLFRSQSTNKNPALTKKANMRPKKVGMSPNGVPEEKTNMANAPAIQQTIAVVAIALLAPSQAIFPGVILLNNDLILEERDFKKRSIV